MCFFKYMRLVLQNPYNKYVYKSNHFADAKYMSYL